MSVLSLLPGWHVPPPPPVPSGHRDGRKSDSQKKLLRATSAAAEVRSEQGGRKKVQSDTHTHTTKGKKVQVVLPLRGAWNAPEARRGDQIMQGSRKRSLTSVSLSLCRSPERETWGAEVPPRRSLLHSFSHL